MYIIGKTLGARRLLKASLESLDYQKDQLLFKELTIALGQLRNSGSKAPDACEVVGITKIIFNHTGLNLSSYLHPIYEGAAISPPMLDAASPMWTFVEPDLRVPNSYRPGIEWSELSEKGTIDLKAGRVTGVFSRVLGHLILGYAMFDYLTDREIAACIIHEIGHMFSYFEAITHTSTLAVNLGHCASELAASNEKETRVQIVLHTAANLQVKVDDINKLAAGSDQTVVTVLMEAYTRRVRSGTGSDFYDYRSWEAYADQFCARHGAGRDSVTGLDKAARRFKEYGDKNMLRSWYIYTVQALMAIVGGVIALTSLLGNVLGVAILAWLGWFFISPWPPEGKYDRPIDRLTRVKNEMVGALKDRSLSDDAQKALHEDIEAVEMVISKIDPHDNLLNIIWRNLTYYRRDNYRQIKFQQELETLANNNLFVAASKLQTLSAA